MKISDLIESLQAVKEKSGDLDVVILTEHDHEFAIMEYIDVGVICVPDEDGIVRSEPVCAVAWPDIMELAEDEEEET